MLKSYIVPINMKNNNYYKEIKKTLDTIIMSLLGVVVYSAISLDVNLNYPPDWIVSLLYFFFILFIVRVTFASSPTIIFIKPSNCKFKKCLAKIFSYITTLLIGVTCSALYTAINSTPEKIIKTSIIFLLCYCLTTISLCFFGYFSINQIIKKK